MPWRNNPLEKCEAQIRLARLEIKTRLKTLQKPMGINLFACLVENAQMFSLLRQG
jgi:hypothetical protein